jgi:hypothetical protein
MSAIDRFRSQTPALADPARAAFAITPSNDQPLAILPKAIIAGSAGTVALRAVDSPSDVTVALAAGQILPLRVLYVRAAGTSATGLVGLA